MIKDKKADDYDRATEFVAKGQNASANRSFSVRLDKDAPVSEYQANVT